MWKPLYDHPSSTSRYGFQKNLVVWKLEEGTIKFPSGLEFQKNLVVWKLYTNFYVFFMWYSVSEELSSVETVWRKFYRNALSSVSEELSSVET